MSIEEEVAYLKVSRQQLYSDLNLALVNFVVPRGDGAFIDLGCGTGSLTEHLLRKFPRASIWAIDPDPSMIDTLRARIGNEVGVVEAAGETFGTYFPPSCIDALYLANALHLIADLQCFFESASRLLKSGGVIAFNTTFYDGGADASQRSLALQLVREAHQFLREKWPNLIPRVGARSAATRPLSRELYTDLLTSNGFINIEFYETKYAFPFASITEFLVTPVFAAGALPGVPSEVAVEAMNAAVQRLEKRSRSVSETKFVRQWLYMSARKA
jgi:trans-aconitate methyltransferase